MYVELRKFMIISILELIANLMFMGPLSKSISNFSRRVYLPQSFHGFLQTIWCWAVTEPDFILHLSEIWCGQAIAILQ